MNNLHFTQSRIAIICSAPIADLIYTKKRILTYSVLIAVDGGINHCHAMELVPNFILGDLDSANPEFLEVFKEVSTQRYPRDKDQTDLELALKLVVHDQIEEIGVFGALGDRTDHTLGNIILLSRYKCKIFLENEKERLFVIRGRTEIPTQPGQVISLIPINGPVQGITTQGLKWPLQNASLDKDFIGISNQATEAKVVVELAQGDLLCCINYFK